jgi:serine/threonine-protein kinase
MSKKERSPKVGTEVARTPLLSSLPPEAAASEPPTSGARGAQASISGEQITGTQVIAIGGKYVVVKPLGAGAMGTVWLTKHATLGLLCAVKVLRSAGAADPEALRRFEREAKAAAALDSPYVVKIFDHGVDEQSGLPFIVMEVLKGESLRDRLERVTTLSKDETVRILAQVARGLSKAHEAGIVHRDLKPDNVFLHCNDEDEVAKVLDFGIAKSSNVNLMEGIKTRTGAFLGTPYYMSPEQVRGAKSVDARSDVYAFGVIAFECLTGARPFDGVNVLDLLGKIVGEYIPSASELANIPPGFDGWFRKAVARRVEERFQSIREASDELRRVCGVLGDAPSSPVHAPPVPESPLWALADKDEPAPKSSESSPPSIPVHSVWLTGSMLVALLAVIAVVLALALRR